MTQNIEVVVYIIKNIFKNWGCKHNETKMS